MLKPKNNHGNKQRKESISNRRTGIPLGNGDADRRLHLPLHLRRVIALACCIPRMQHAFTPMRGDLTTGLPRPLLGLRITPFDDGRESGRYLIESENGNFVVNDRMRCLIEALAAHSSMSALKAHLEVGAHATLDEADISAAITWLPQSLFADAARSVAPAWLAGANGKNGTVFSAVRGEPLRKATVATT